MPEQDSSSAPPAQAPPSSRRYSIEAAVDAYDRAHEAWRASPGADTDRQRIDALMALADERAALLKAEP
jgi:hypothetical protein